MPPKQAPTHPALQDLSRYATWKDMKEWLEHMISYYSRRCPPNTINPRQPRQIAADVARRFLHEIFHLQQPRFELFDKPLVFPNPAMRNKFDNDFLPVLHRDYTGWDPDTTDCAYFRELKKNGWIQAVWQQYLQHRGAAAPPANFYRIYLVNIPLAPYATTTVDKYSRNHWHALSVVIQREPRGPHAPNTNTCFIWDSDTDWKAADSPHHSGYWYRDMVPSYVQALITQIQADSSMDVWVAGEGNDGTQCMPLTSQWIRGLVSAGDDIDTFFQLGVEIRDERGRWAGVRPNSQGLVWYKYVNRDLPAPPQAAARR